VNRHELLDQVFDAVERHDLEAVEAWFEQHATPDVEFTSALTSEVEGRVYRGKRGLVNWANDISEAVTITYGPREFRDLGQDVVVVLVRPRLEGRGSGVEMQLDIGFVIEFEGDLARRGASYPSHEEALAVAEARAARSQSDPEPVQ
jgi:ketosteroid isomerase-like protein